MPLSPNGHLRILITEGSSTSSRQTLVTLGAGYDIDVLDPGRLCLSRFSRYVRRFHRCPPIGRDPKAYLQFLLRRLHDDTYDVLFPTHEQVYLLSRFREELGRVVGLAVPDFDAVRRVQCKAGFARLLEQLAIPGPQTAILKSWRAWQDIKEFPCYVKLPHSTAGNGVRFVSTAHELSDVLQEFKRAGRLDEKTEVVIQQPVSGTMCVAYAVFQNGKMKGIHCTEAESLGVGGAQMLRVGVSHPKVVEYVARLGEHLEWHGAIFLDYLYDSARQTPCFIEGNPRIGETVNAMLSGVNLSQMLVRISLGDTVDPAASSQPGVRSHNGFMSLLAAAEKGAGRAKLLREIWSLTTGSGAYRNVADEMLWLREDYLSAVPTLFVAGRLLISPRCGERIVTGAVNRYAVPESAARLIDELPDDIVQQLVVK